MVLSLFNEKAGLSKLSYFLSNPECFFHRYADTGFKNKWTGFWCSGKKLIEFIAFKCGDEFLSEKNCYSLKYDFARAEHSHKTEKGSIVQRLWIPREKPALVAELSSKKKIGAELLLAANIRAREENSHSRRYAVKESGKGISISSEAGALRLKALKGKLSFKEKPFYGTHFPAGEKQCFFSPGKILLEGRHVSIAFSPKKVQKIAGGCPREKKKIYSALDSKMKSDCRELEECFSLAAKSIELLRSKHSFYAGLPWFTQYWGRDVFWSLPAVTELGFFGYCRDSLALFAKNSKKGRIPNFLSAKGNSYSSIDATPLFLIALTRYAEYSADKGFIKKMLPAAMECVSFLERSISRGTFVSHDFSAGETWMDTLRRNDNAIEVQSLALKAFQSFNEMLKAMGMPESPALNERIRVFSEAFPSAFSLGNGFFADRLVSGEKDSTKRINVLVPMLLGQIESREQLDLFHSKEFAVKRGITPISMSDARFNPDSYHEGSVWSLGNAWLAAAAFALGEKEKGFTALKEHCSDFWENALGCIGETFNPLTGAMNGCALQLWASAMVVRIVDEFILGMKANAFEKTISLEPRFPKEVSSIKRKIFLGGKEFALSVKRKNGSMEARAGNKSVKVRLLER